jgi:hypothetical protein
MPSLEPTGSGLQQTLANYGKGILLMTRWIGALLLALAVTSAEAAGVAVCTLGADNKTVTVTANNPHEQTMACEVNCHMAIPGGIATVVCVRPVPAGAKDFVMCSEPSKAGVTYTRVKETESNCPDPTAPPPVTKSETKVDDEDDAKDDAKTEAMMQKLMQQGQDFIDKHKQQ